MTCIIVYICNKFVILYRVDDRNSINSDLTSIFPMLFKISHVLLQQTFTPDSVLILKQIIKIFYYFSTVSKF